MNDTPETDALETTTMFTTRQKDPICGEVLLHARRMERERDEARIIANGMRWLLPDSSPVVEFPWEVTE